MSGIITIAGSVYGSYSGQNLDIVSGSPTINGGSNTVQSSVSGVGIVLTGGNNAISLGGSADTLIAGDAASGGVSGDTLLLTGNYNTIEDNGFSGGGVTINGSYNNFSSQQRIETSNIVVNGNNDTVSATYMNGNFVIAGNNALVYANNGAFTVSGANDTVFAANAQSILVTGSGATVLVEASPGSTFPTALLGGAAQATQDSTPGTTISITGSGANVTTYNNNDTVTSSGNGNSVSLLSFGDSATLSGGNSSVSAQSQTETISVAGAQDTVSTSTSLFSGTPSSTVPSSTVAVDSVVAASTTYNAGTSTIVDTIPGGGPSTVNVTAGGTSIIATAGGTYNDSIGGNSYTIGGGTKLNLASGGNTVNVADGQFLTQDTLGGAAGSPNTIILGSGNIVDLTASGVAAGYDILSVNGSGNSGFIYGAPASSLYLGGSGNLFAVLANPTASSTAGGLLSIAGADTLSVWSGNNSIVANNGASLFVVSGNNTITGDNAALTLQGDGNMVNLTGQSTISDSNPWQYGTSTNTDNVQNQFTVQGGQFNLGGKDTLLQSSSSAAITLTGGNSATLNGANDSITATDQLYGGNNIILGGSGTDSVHLVNVSDSAATINANVNAFVTASDDTGPKIGDLNTNSNEHLLFIGGSGTSNTVFAAGSNTQVTLFGGSSSNNIVSGGDAGNNSLNGELGGGNLFRAGGTNDVLIGGAAGANTIVSAAGNETLTGAGLGNDLFSITGGGGTDMIQNFTGQLVVASTLTVSSETVSGGALNVYLNDGTHLIFSGLTSVSQNGNLFTH
ncbi:MAG: S-layer family protein [Rhodospirillales bacterium]|nr:S-layer family protein [Rhodospirillales bacterium]